MSYQVILGLGLQLLSVCLVLRRVRGAWLSHAGALFLLAAFAYHGLTEPTQALFPNRNAYRWWMPVAALDRWVVVVSAAMLLFAAAYVLALGPVAHARVPTEALVRGMPPWQTWMIGAAFAFPVVIGAQRGTTSGYWVVGLGQEFLTLAVVVGSALATINRPRLLFPLLAIQSILLSAAGSRLTVIAAAVALLACAAYVGHGPSRKALITAAVAGILLVVLLSNARAEIGRETFAAAPTTERLRLMIGGLRGIDRDAVLDDIVYRFDGNVFPALLTDRFLSGHPGTGLEPLRNAAYRAIPSFLAPGKLQTDLAVRSEEEWISERFGLPVEVDFLPTTLGVLFAYYGQLGLLLMAPALGVAFGRADRWLHAAVTPARLVVLAGMAEAITLYERGTEIWFTTARAALVLAVLVIAWSLLRGRKRTMPTHRQGPVTAQQSAPHWGLSAARRHGTRRSDAG